MKKKKWHYRDIKKNAILQKVKNILLPGSWVSTREIQRQTGSTRPASDCSELRANGFDILCRYDYTDQRTGNRIYRYRMLIAAFFFLRIICPSYSQDSTFLTAASALMVSDSCDRVVDVDSIALHRQEVAMFKCQISLKGKIDVPTRLECLEFMLEKKLRTPASVKIYLNLLQKWCQDRGAWIMAYRATLQDEDKYKAVAVYRHAQVDCAAIAAMIDRLAGI